MDKKFVIASKNIGKVIEIKEILKDLPFDVITMEEAGFYDNIEETGTSFEENSMIKARAIFDKTGYIVMADDSGLEVDYLNGAPGIYSARFAGINSTSKERIDKLLSLLQGVPLEKRTARFVCCITVIINKDTYFTTTETCEGLIISELIGHNGFGYDPIFYIPEFKKTMAEITPELKNKISHRAKALISMKNKLNRIS